MDPASVRRKRSFGRKQSGFSKAESVSAASVDRGSLLKEGYLDKHSSGLVKKWQSRYFELSTGHLLMAQLAH